LRYSNDLFCPANFYKNQLKPGIMYQKYYRWIKTMAISTIILGCLHLIATPFVMPAIKSAPDDIKPVFLFMFLAAGFGTILPGVVILNQSIALKLFQNRAWKLCFLCSIYILILGILAVVTMSGNPFTYICAVLGVLLFIPLLKRRKTFTN
jgi:hypothetical protein